jgi:hypothetical protein
MTRPALVDETVSIGDAAILLILRLLQRARTLPGSATTIGARRVAPRVTVMREAIS